MFIGKLISWQAWSIRGGSKAITDHFHELVPDLALEFPFELDAFQKEVYINDNSLLIYPISTGYINLTGGRNYK